MTIAVIHIRKAADVRETLLTSELEVLSNYCHVFLVEDLASMSLAYESG